MYVKHESDLSHLHSTITVLANTTLSVSKALSSDIDTLRDNIVATLNSLLANVTQWVNTVTATMMTASAAMRITTFLMLANVTITQAHDLIFRLSQLTVTLLEFKEFI